MAAALAAGCGGSGEPKDIGRHAADYVAGGVVRPRYAYPPGSVRGFVRACASSPGQRKVCGCTIERLQSTLPFAQFTAADRAIRDGRPLDESTRAAIDDATEACRQ